MQPRALCKRLYCLESTQRFAAPQTIWTQIRQLLCKALSLLPTQRRQRPFRIWRLSVPSLLRMSDQVYDNHAGQTC